MLLECLDTIDELREELAAWQASRFWLFSVREGGGVDFMASFNTLEEAKTPNAWYNVQRRQIIEIRGGSSVHVWVEKEKNSNAYWEYEGGG